MTSLHAKGCSTPVFKYLAEQAPPAPDDRSGCASARQSRPRQPGQTRPFWLARDLDSYQRDGLDVDLVELQATPAVIAAMRAGDVGKYQLR
jgi:hypothetical protein